MKKVFTILILTVLTIDSYGQCSSLGVQISSSDTSMVQLYQAGFFLIPNGSDNIVEWEVTSFSGQIIHRDTTFGTTNNDQSTTMFNHSVPLIDSMKATIVITNATEGITCTMVDTLYWEETEVLPGSFTGNWEVLSSNAGVEENISSTLELVTIPSGIELYPNPASNQFTISSEWSNYSFLIFGSNGQLMESHQSKQNQTQVNISHYQAGVYFVQFWDVNNKSIGFKKFVKTEE